MQSLRRRLREVGAWGEGVPHPRVDARDPLVHVLHGPHRDPLAGELVVHPIERPSGHRIQIDELDLDICRVPRRVRLVLEQLQLDQQEPQNLRASQPPVSDVRELHDRRGPSRLTDLLEQESDPRVVQGVRRLGDDLFLLETRLEHEQDRVPVVVEELDEIPGAREGVPRDPVREIELAQVGGVGRR